MKRALLVLLLCGCTKNHAELEDRLDVDSARLAILMARANKLNDHRRALEEAQEELARALAQFPEEKAEIDEALMRAPEMPTFAPLPPQSAFEGGRGARLRQMIGETDARIMALSQIVSEVEKLDARRRHVERQLAGIRERHPPPK